MVYIILGTGFEPAEAIVPCDILRRGGVEVKMVGIGGKEIAAGHGITVMADCTMEDLAYEDLQMIVLPGGLGGVESILNCQQALDAVQYAYEHERFVAAICAAPTILAKLHITDEKDATCYPGMEQKMGSAVCAQQSCVRDGKLITGQAAGSAYEFGLALLAALKGDAAAQKVADAIVYRK